MSALARAPPSAWSLFTGHDKWGGGSRRSLRVGDVFTVEVVGNDLCGAGGEVLDGEFDEIDEVGGAPSGDVGVDVLVEQLVGVELGGIGRQEEDPEAGIVVLPAGDCGGL